MTFDRLLEKLAPTLKRITRKLNVLPVFIDDDDLYQEAVLHLWRTYEKGGTEDKTDSYILQGCYYHLKNYLRTVHDKAQLLSFNEPFGEEGQSLEEMVSSGDLSDLDYLEGKLEVEAVMHKSCLNKREREVLDLLMEGMTVREAGGHLGISHVMVVKIKNRIGQKYTLSSMAA